MPFYRYRLDVRLAPRRVADRIRAVTDAPVGFWKSSQPDYFAGRPFWGHVDDFSFRIWRSHRYLRTYFRPAIWGRISAIPTGSRVTITMSFHPIPSALLAIFVALVAYRAIKTLNDSGSWVDLAALMWAILLLGSLFAYEVSRTRELLDSALGKRHE